MKHLHFVLGLFLATSGIANTALAAPCLQWRGDSTFEVVCEPSLSEYQTILSHHENMVAGLERDLARAERDSSGKYLVKWGERLQEAWWIGGLVALEARVSHNIAFSRSIARGGAAWIALVIAGDLMVKFGEDKIALTEEQVGLIEEDLRFHRNRIRVLRDLIRSVEQL